MRDACERELGRIAADADVDTLTLIGAGHLLFAGWEGAPPDAGAVENVVTTVIAGEEPRTAAVNGPSACPHPGPGADVRN